MTQIRSRVSRLTLTEVVYFITTVTRNREPLFQSDSNIELLRKVLREVQAIHPFGMRGFVFLKDHLHLLLFIPDGTNISKLMQSVKRSFTSAYKETNQIETSLNLWQRSFYDHVIRTQKDLVNHLNYIHYNPVKHGYVSAPEMWKHSSFLEYERRGWYELGWGHREVPYDSEVDEKALEWGE